MAISRLTENLLGRTFSRWTVIGLARIGKGGARTWICQCVCGTKLDVPTHALLSGNSRSRKCLRNERLAESRVKHGKSKTSEYNIWRGIKDRCLNPKSQQYDNYGGRGITICDEWRDSFIDFYKYVGSKPNQKDEIDRFPDNNGNYEPGNVRWATRKQQTRNTRVNHQLTFNGKTQCVGAWAEELGVNRYTILKRIKKGWPNEKVFSSNVDQRQSRAIHLKMIEFDGKTQSVTEWSRETGIPESTLLALRRNS